MTDSTNSSKSTTPTGRDAALAKEGAAIDRVTPGDYGAPDKETGHRWMHEPAAGGQVRTGVITKRGSELFVTMESAEKGKEYLTAYAEQNGQ